MQPQAHRAVRSTVSDTATRGQLKNNVVQWRAKGPDQPTSAPAKPSRFAISPRAQNVILWIVGIAAACIFGASQAGVL